MLSVGMYFSAAAHIPLAEPGTEGEVVPADGIKGIVDLARRHGLIVGHSGGDRHLGNPIVLSPPLVITRAEIDRIVAVLDHAIAAAGAVCSSSVGKCRCPERRA